MNRRTHGAKQGATPGAGKAAPGTDIHENDASGHEAAASSRSGRRQRRSAQITDDDAALWASTAQTLEPLRKSKPRVHPALTDDANPVTFAPKGGDRHGKNAASTDARVRGARQAETQDPARAGSAAVRAAPALQPFEIKRARRLRAGRLEIEARIDLHGMKQAEAHAALRRFLTACQADGRRMVLVITGKGGGPMGGRADDGGGWGSERERGVLKRNVPRWLAEPDLRHLVVSYTEAAIRHGGEGALYVHLRAAGP